MWTWLRSIFNAVLGKVPGKPGRVDTATTMATDADFSGRGSPAATPKREPQEPPVDPLDELMRIVGEREPEPLHQDKVLRFPGRRRRPKSRG